MLTVVCVLKSGGEYGTTEVESLRKSVAANLRRAHKFICLTDYRPETLDCETRPLKHDWKGWWSKIELFRPEALPPGPKFYLDLDTIAVRPFDDITLDHRFTVLTNFWADDRIGSGLMAWNVDLSEIYNKFLVNPSRFMHEYKTTERWGDQGFIRFNTPVPLDRWQRLYPGRVVSFKRHCIPERGVPAGASIVCFHGKPRPWELNTFQRRWFGDASKVSQKFPLGGARTPGPGGRHVQG